MPINLFVNGIFTILIIVLSWNTVSAASSRTKCTSVEQEVLDFKTLEKNIRKTKAIGVMAKLKLSGDINKMLKEIKAFHAGNSSLTLEKQREQYDLLYMKVVTLVEKKDPELLHQLCNTWDPLWVALQDEENLKKFSQAFVPEAIVAEIYNMLLLIINVAIPTADAEEALVHDDVVKKDLFIVITLHGVHCVAVVEYEQISDQHYVATCESGERYRVHVSEDGRVIMEPHHDE